MNTSTQQDQPQPGNVYSLATLAKTGKWSAAAIQHTGLPLGARVSYGDMANPRSIQSPESPIPALSAATRQPCPEL